MYFADLKRAEKYQFKNMARKAVTEAIKTGTLIRPSVCSRCGDIPKRSVEGHHEDYSKPLDIIWLCRSCHGRRHAQLRRAEASARPPMPKITRPRCGRGRKKTSMESIPSDYKNLLPRMRKPKSAPDKRRRLTQREESAVALIALRMVIAEREWNPGDAPVVRMLDMMFRALEYQIAAKAFGAWLTRLGIQTLRRGGRKLVVVPVSFDEAEAALRKLTGSGHTLATAVKPAVLEQACRMTESIAGGSQVLGHRDSAPTVQHRSDGRTVNCQHQDPPWLQPSDPATVVADLDEIDRILEIQEGGDATEATTRRTRPEVAVTRGPHAAPAEPRKPLNDFLDEEED